MLRYIAESLLRKSWTETNTPVKQLVSERDAMALAFRQVRLEWQLTDPLLLRIPKLQWVCVFKSLFNLVKVYGIHLCSFV